MSRAYLQLGATRILCEDASLFEDRENWLHPEYWAARNAIAGHLTGRGVAWQVETPVGPAVLRRFRRGGMVAGLLGDRYMFTGWARSRAFREWRLLVMMRARGLPVPIPLAASCERAGPWYRAGLLTTLIPGTDTLADRVETGNLDDDEWRAVGSAIRKFHDAGVEHADLNCRNILLDGGGEVYLLDFDRGRLSSPGVVKRRHMLSRLRRSLDKAGRDPEGAGWKALMTGYEK